MTVSAKLATEEPAPDAAPFSHFAPPIREQSALRQAITAAYRRPETECLPFLVDAATLPESTRESAKKTAQKLIEALRAKHKGDGVEGLVQEYSLSSQEGVALMCLAEALLRIPDTATRDALIRDKIAGGDWKSHIGGGRSMFVNAATWGLVVTGKLTSTVNESGLSASLTKLIARAGEPVIRRGVDMAMRMMGEQFVTGETIDEALKRARALEAKGFRYSYDMLGEAATTHADAERYYRDYENAIHAIGKASAGRGIYEGPGISIKLSALHPRYSRSQADRVMGELLPKVKALALLSKGYNIGLNIDAEEADRLELSLDLLEELCLDPDLSGWDGIGFVVQAYGKRCPFVLDFIIDLARRSGHRLMVRLVKGAYWDAEIKRAQLDGLDGFPVYTRKIYTDVSYVACAKKLLAATDVVFPQFATHNAQSLATIYQMAGSDFSVGKYEFQCLHGMGEPLYEEVVGAQNLNRPCRIYAPVGTHETLLAYLVRRLLENGANSSFVNKIADPSVPVSELIADPVERVRAMTVVGAQHDKIVLPVDLFGAARQNSGGIDLSNETALTELSRQLQTSAASDWVAKPLLADGSERGVARAVLNPADHADIVGHVTELEPQDAPDVMRLAATAAEHWAAVRPDERAAILERAADLMQSEMPVLVGLTIREAGKSAANAVGEIREAIDFLRYYAAQARKVLTPESMPLGPVVCISPWNFPLAIFTGQVAAALVAGNPVVAKAAGNTPLIAAQGVRILHEAGIPRDVLQFAPGSGRMGAALVGAPETAGVMFTGSTEVARLIQAQLAERLSKFGKPIPLIAETGGQNGMIVDSSALAEQVVGDVIASAFDSAGQRCSALRVLCLQEEVADRTLTMLRGALRELSVGKTDRLAVDIGPVIDDNAKRGIDDHIERMRQLGCNVEQLDLPSTAAKGTFVAPTIIELKKLSDLKREVFGPVLHIMRYQRKGLDKLIADINASGYGLTFGLHTRLDDTIAHVTERVRAGNLYVNRNIIGAVVGVQPFGGRGLSGTGPKAGGPMYLRRLVASSTEPLRDASVQSDPAAQQFVAWLESKGNADAANQARAVAAQSSLGFNTELQGPVGELNLYALHPRGRVLLAPQTALGLHVQIAAGLATGNSIVIDAASGLQEELCNLPAQVANRISWSKDWAADGPFAGALIEGDAERVQQAIKVISAIPGPLVLTQAASSEEIAQNAGAYCLNWLLEEVTTSINTAAAGGNASLMTIG
ncbi:MULTISPECIES: trifunctional transcriptional regulator/proline dehydrogenase/L-glutamate gamma-semialdehyde dehydrogenase [unclassified Rhizobium]|jgi:RHH-type proline utilization regulon transcriptional repressor/proline dehydrogenase/delta 1-pyrroline-5-carboxylate dehydrogenase|uniref:trifunctional transcriptional regulator/proline dehydrogenase/L-glutamate gamma-semialdehyde dehydrogenase n=1 Tax=unclassified Rhizobium TaxID=2613769 RepID=UPI0006480AB8|nr:MULTISPECIES: trifunctional transcriptional regulator/proline dehydrogenase/L-glutamate gamma-semialdehyde dehydrogenase [unclassified Rhizobium]OJY63864.1 MAG: trifunctional transcriptional regulator/proline dehydrogenase/L-glutamate gamma-semialdehyde dehydrogenase [Rhizobium sp. 60-20]RKD60857.1 L-proline dehydrogenase /delta-1-pyrroline-5-carboxylate dehydrogenase [Rhizobium sp. WW_1]